MLSILVVSYNTLDLTVACLSSLCPETRAAEMEVIVVDNASVDNSATAIATTFPGVRLLKLTRNLGFAAANNLAARVARGNWLLLLNPDTVVIDRGVEQLLEFAEVHPETSILGGRTVFADGSLNPASCWRRPTLWSVFCIASGLTLVFGRWGWFAQESYGRWRRDTVREVDIVSGCFFLIRRSVWDELGGFDPAFFMYGEEADLCLRAKKLGHKCLICPDAQIIHHGGASERVRSDKMVKLFVAKSMLFERHWSPAAARWGIAMLDMWAFSRMFVTGVLRIFSRRWTKSHDEWRNVWRRRDAWHHAPTVASAGPDAVVNRI